MKLLLFGRLDDARLLKEFIFADVHFAYRQISIVECDDYDQYVQELGKGCSLVFVFAHGARGMESVIAAKNVNADVPVVWISDDKDFAVQSYRLGVAYFGVHPITHHHVSSALQRLRSARSD